MTLKREFLQGRTITDLIKSQAAPVEAEREPVKDQIITTGPRYLGIYRPHTAQDLDIKTWGGVKTIAADTAQHFITQGLGVFFLFEEATKRKLKFTAEMGKWLRGEETESINLKSLADLFQVGKDPEGTYDFMLFRFFHELQQLHGANKVWGILERRIGLQAIGEQAVKQMVSPEVSLELKLTRFIQLASHSVTRDLRVAGQALDEMANEQLGLIIFRGIGHHGLSTALKVLAERAGLAEDGPFADIHQPRKTTLHYSVYVPAQILWSECFWREIIEEHNLNLDTLRRNPILQRVYDGIRRKLRQEPWITHLRERIEETAHDPLGVLGLYPIELTQTVF